MLPEEWPIAAGAADHDAPARHAGGDRLRTVRADFFLNPADRLTEQERALMTAMLHCLVGDIADEVRAALPTGVAAAAQATAQRAARAGVGRRHADVRTLGLVVHAPQGMGNTAAMRLALVANDAAGSGVSGSTRKTFIRNIL